MSRSSCERPRRAKRVSYTMVGDELVLYDPASNRYLVLNGTAAFLWNRMDGTSTVAELRDGLVERYEVAPDTALDDLLELVAELQSRGLVEDAPSGD